jgi:hypothetical protein
MTQPHKCATQKYFVNNLSMKKDGFKDKKALWRA